MHGLMERLRALERKYMKLMNDYRAVVVRVRKLEEEIRVLRQVRGRS